MNIRIVYPQHSLICSLVYARRIILSCTLRSSLRIVLSNNLSKRAFWTVESTVEISLAEFQTAQNCLSRNPRLAHFFAQLLLVDFSKNSYLGDAKIKEKKLTSVSAQIAKMASDQINSRIFESTLL